MDECEWFLIVGLRYFYKIYWIWCANWGNWHFFWLSTETSIWMVHGLFFCINLPLYSNIYSPISCSSTIILKGFTAFTLFRFRNTITFEMYFYFSPLIVTKWLLWTVSSQVFILYFTNGVWIEIINGTIYDAICIVVLFWFNENKLIG